jgi:hypothetical protein
MIYAALYVMLLMREDTLREQVGGGWALEIETFLDAVKWHQVVAGECYLGPKKLRFPVSNPLPLAQVMDLPPLCTGCINR